MLVINALIRRCWHWPCLRKSTSWSQWPCDGEGFGGSRPDKPDLYWSILRQKHAADREGKNKSIFNNWITHWSSTEEGDEMPPSLVLLPGKDKLMIMFRSLLCPMFWLSGYIVALPWGCTCRDKSGLEKIRPNSLKVFLSKKRSFSLTYGKRSPKRRWNSTSSKDTKTIFICHEVWALSLKTKCDFKKD